LVCVLALAFIERCDRGPLPTNKMGIRVATDL
jgi:hypothetical protein